MNYHAIYGRLIERARVRVLDAYTESHHVFPRCIGGGDEAGNIVELTPEEHCVAHLLLVRVYPDHPGLVHAANLMANRAGGNKAYGWLRRRHAALMITARSGITLPPEWRAAIAAGNTGKTMSMERRQKIAASLRGKPAVRSPEGVARIAAAARARMLSDANPARQRKALRLRGE